MMPRQGSQEGVCVKGWYLLAHPLFLDELESLIEAVECLHKESPLTYQNKNLTKRLFAIVHLIFEKIPQDPGLPEYRQGLALGSMMRKQSVLIRKNQTLMRYLKKC